MRVKVFRLLWWTSRPKQTPSKQDMKGWQKDYVSVLADLEKKIDDSQDEIRNLAELKESINSLKTDIEKMTHPPDNSVPDTPPSLTKIEHTNWDLSNNKGKR